MPKALSTVTAKKATVLRKWADGIRERWSRSGEMAAAREETDMNIRLLSYLLFVRHAELVFASHIYDKESLITKLLKQVQGDVPFYEVLRTFKKIFFSLLKLLRNFKISSTLNFKFVELKVPKNEDFNNRGRKGVGKQYPGISF
nr:hypothetical protein [uncultured Draconibacterium sp.]